MCPRIQLPEGVRVNVPSDGLAYKHSVWHGEHQYQGSSWAVAQPGQFCPSVEKKASSMERGFPNESDVSPGSSAALEGWIWATLISGFNS